MKLYKYTEQQLRQAVQESSSIRSTLQKLGVAAYGGNYEIFKKAVEYFNIDTSHFLGKRANRGHKFGYKQPLSFYLRKNIFVVTSRLRKRLLIEGIFPHKCCDCGNTTWNDFPIPLELHHVDGDRKNNDCQF